MQETTLLALPVGTYGWLNPDQHRILPGNHGNEGQVIRSHTVYIEAHTGTIQVYKINQSTIQIDTPATWAGLYQLVRAIRR